MPFCRSCGNKVLEEDVFCGKCGTRLNPGTKRGKGKNNPPPAPAEPRREPEVSPPPPQSRPPVPPAPSPPPEQPLAPIKPKARKSGGLTFFGVLIALGWLFYSSGMMGVLAGVYPLYPDQMIQQADWISFGLMIGLPLGIAMFRPVLDIVLIPLQPIRFRIPGKMLVGMGLVAPFAVAWVLYDAWGFRNYEFLHVSLIFGTLISYAILRTPARYSA